MGAYMLERSDPMLRFKFRDQFSYADYTRKYCPRTSKRYESYCRRKKLIAWEHLYTIDRYVCDHGRRLFDEMAAGEHVDSRDAYWSALDNALLGTLSDLAVLGVVREKHPNTMAFASELHARAMPVVEPQSTLTNLWQVVAGLQQVREIPSFASFSWNQILELRRDPYVKAFRAKVVDLVAKRSSDNESDVQTLDVELIETLWKITADLKPTPTRVIRTGLDPLLSIFGALFGLASQWQHARKYGWVFFLENARSLAKKKEFDATRNV